MAKKHSPGCYCCQCDCGTVSPPTITISGYTASGEWQSVSDCCKEIVFNPNDTSTTTCCDNLYEKTWTQQCVRKLWGKTVLHPYATCGEGCPPDPSKYCMPSTFLFHTGTLTIDYFEKHELRLVVGYKKPTITVSFGRDNFTCSGATSCKYFIRIKLCYPYVASYLGRTTWTQTTSVAAVSPCVVANTSYNETISSPGYGTTWSCGDAVIPPNPSTVCFERIKIFDTLPADGDFVFTNADNGSDCTQFPFCGKTTYDEQICFQGAIEGVCNPCWDAHTIVNDSVTYQYGGNDITSISGFCGCGIDESCLPFVVNCSGNKTTCPVVSQTLSCQKVVFTESGVGCGAEYLSQPLTDINGTKCYPYFPGGSGPCQFYSTSPDPPFTDTYVCFGSSPCNSTCCFHLDCNDCSICEPLIDPTFAWSQEITVSKTCTDLRDSNYCCIQFPTTTLSIDFP